MLLNSTFNRLLFAFLAFIFEGDRTIGTAALMLLATLGDMRIGHGAA